MRSFLVLLSIIGACAGQDLLPEGPVKAIVKRNVTFETLVELTENFTEIAWSFDRCGELLPIITVTPTGQTVAAGYQGRVQVNHTNGFLTLTKVEERDRGFYQAAVQTSEYVKTGETMLRVLGSREWFALPEGPVDAVSGKKAIFKTLMGPKDQVNAIAWFFDGGSGTVRVVTVDEQKEEFVFEGYRERVTVNHTNGLLTLSSASAKDNGRYFINIWTTKGLMTGNTSLSVLGKPKAAWSVTFQNQDACALRGSSVQFSCSYDYPAGEIVRNTGWFKGENKSGGWKRTALSETLSSFEDRVKYIGDQEHDCSLEIYDVQESDSGYYYFRFDTQTYGWRSRGSVYLSLTGLAARVRPNRVNEGQTVTLTCDTSCELSGPARIIWLRNELPVDKPVQFQARAEDAGNYTCAVEGHERVRSDPVTLNVEYAPVNVSVELSSKSLTEGDSVNLTCSSAGNPAAESYTWYRRSASSSLQQVGSGQVLSLTSLQKSDAGLYVCQARNLLGENNSADVLLEVDAPEISPPESASTVPSDPPFTPDVEEAGTTAVFIHVTAPPDTSSRTTLSSYTSSDGSTAHSYRDTRPDCHEIQRVRFDKLQAELKEMRLSFERSLRQMESRTHSLLWSMSRRLEQVTEARGSHPYASKTFMTLGRFMSSGAAAVNPSSQPPGRRPMNLPIGGQRGGKNNPS